MQWSIWAFPTLMVALVRSTQKILQIAIKLPKRSKPVVHVGHFLLLVLAGVMQMRPVEAGTTLCGTLKYVFTFAIHYYGKIFWSKI